MPMMHARSKLAGIACLLCCAQSALAGHYYEATTVTESDDRRGAETVDVQVWVEGDSTRVQFTEGGGSELFGPGAWLVTRDAGANMLLVNDEKKTWAEFNLGSMADAASQMGGMFKMEFTGQHSEKLSEEPGGAILGHDTQHVRVRSGYTMNMAVMGIKQSQKVEMEQEMWTTDAFDPRAFAVWLRPDKRMGSSIPGLTEMMETQFEALGGVPLKSVVTTRSTDQKGRVTTSVATTHVKSLREESVPDTRFEIPADYRQEQLMVNPAGQPGQAEQKGFKLGDMFKRGDRG